MGGPSELYYIPTCTIRDNHLNSTLDCGLGRTGDISSQHLKGLRHKGQGTEREIKLSHVTFCMHVLLEQHNGMDRKVAGWVDGKHQPHSLLVERQSIKISPINTQDNL